MDLADEAVCDEQPPSSARIGTTYKVVVKIQTRIPAMEDVWCLLVGGRQWGRNWFLCGLHLREIRRCRRTVSGAHINMSKAASAAGGASVVTHCEERTR